jgi:hypothetical protein
MNVLSITVNIDNDVKMEWLVWMKSKVEALLTDTKIVHHFRILKIVTEELEDGSNYSFQFYLTDLNKLQKFEEHYDLEVATDMYRFYREKFVEFRTKLEVIDWDL